MRLLRRLAESSVRHAANRTLRADAPAAPRESGRARRAVGQAGFTLLEILITLAVLGLLMTMLLQGVRFGIAAWQVQARTLSARGDLDAAERMLRTLVAEANPGSLGGTPPLFKGLPYSVTFTTVLPEAVGAVGPREADVTLAVDQAHRLVLLFLPHYRNRIGPSPPPQEVVLLTGVERMDIAYWQEAGFGQKAEWQTEWQRREMLPKLVRFHLVLAARGRGYNPDIVVAPRRDRWRA
jgi:general secretion pathway protein J